MELSIALDRLAEDESATLAMGHALAQVEGEFGFKANDDYLMSRGLANGIRNVQALGRKVFADIKMWKGSRTMVQTAKDLADLGVDYFNIYALADTQLPMVVEAIRGTPTKLFALTVLSHYDDSYCRSHFRRSLKATVRHFAAVAIDNGCDGIIIPGALLSVVADLPIKKMATGNRPCWFQDTRHEQAVTLLESKQGGADIAVIGSPIFNSDDPVAALRRSLADLK